MTARSTTPGTNQSSWRLNCGLAQPLAAILRPGGAGSWSAPTPPADSRATARGPRRSPPCSTCATGPLGCAWSPGRNAPTPARSRPSPMSTATASRGARGVPVSIRRRGSAYAPPQCVAWPGRSRRRGRRSAPGSRVAAARSRRRGRLPARSAASRHMRRAARAPMCAWL